jgi:DNA repair protein RecO (recombination protein O)
VIKGALQRGFVLHRRDYSNTSLLLEVLVIEQGRFAAIAKGAKRARSPLAALLQPFQPLWLGWSGRGEVKTLTGVEAADRTLELRGPRLYCGFYVNELLMRLWPRQEIPDALFAAYQQVLEELAGDEVEAELGLRQFELRLLAAMGYELVLDRLADHGEPLKPQGRYVVQPDQGVYPALASDAAIDGGAVLTGETLLRLARGESMNPVQRREARDLMRRALAPHLGSKPLRSRELFQSLQAGATKAQQLNTNT